MRTTGLYGALMAGVSLLGQLVLYPLLAGTMLEPWMDRGICAVFCVVGIALFIRPMLDLHSTEYTTLWVKDRRFRLPLISLTVLRFLLVMLLVFIPLRTLLGIHSLWLLVMIAAAIVLIQKSGWMSSVYIHAETRFIANLNERLLNENHVETAQWLDEKLFVEEIACGEEEAGKTLKQLNWGYFFSVNVIKVLRGSRHHNMPSGDMELRAGDRLVILGRPEDLRSLRLKQNREGDQTPDTLHQFIEDQEDLATDVYVYALPVGKDSAFQGKSIRSSRLKEDYDCMVLGIQRNKLPILQPDVNMIIQPGDLVWVLGDRRMAEKLLALEFSES